MRVDFTISRTSVSDEKLAENVSHARTLGLPGVSRWALNVIGRGPSVAGHVRFLQGSEHNLACGTAWAWCRDNGIEATMMMVDPNPRLASPEYTRGVKKAYVASQCDPAMFDALKSADVRLLDEDKSNLGSTAATVAMVIGAYLGFPKIRLYGCESCYAETTHANEDIPQPNLMVVRANGETFRTNPQMLIQAEEMSSIFRMTTPGVYVNCSGGLLGALIASGGEWELVEWDNAPDNVRALMDAGKQ